MSSDLQMMSWMDSKFTHLTAIASANLHETRELRREVHAMSKRRTRGLIAQYLSPGLIRWYIALVMLAMGHFAAADLREMLVKPIHRMDGSR